MTYTCIWLSTCLVENLIAEILISVLLIWVFGFVLFSWLVLLFLPVTTFLGVLLGFFFSEDGTSVFAINRYSLLGFITVLVVSYFFKKPISANSTPLESHQAGGDTRNKVGNFVQVAKYDNSKMVRSTLINSLKIYKNAGMSGLIVYSQDCYRSLNSGGSLNDLKTCALIDIFSQKLDTSTTKKLHVENEPYFAVDNFHKRIGPSFKALELTREQTNQHLLSWEQDLQDVIKEITNEPT